jgi:hypothetical protein
MAKEIPYKIYLEENEMPTQWYNVRADMKKKPAPILNPATLQPVTLDELSHIFCTELAKSFLKWHCRVNEFLFNLLRCVFSVFHCLTISGRADIYT